MPKRTVSLIIIISFFLTSLGPFPKAYADPISALPAPGTMVNLSPAYAPVIIKGLTVHKDNPFLFDFIVDVGQDKMSGEPLKKEGEKLIRYFLAGLAIPDKDVWVNLSPYEKNRMIPGVLGRTDMGRDLLEQDYILKQLTASLIYPERDLGKKFWDRVYAKARQMYGTTQIPVNTFNKVWIMADRAEVFERRQTAFVVDSHLKVMLEEDYLALQKHEAVRNDTGSIGANIVRQIILPELEKEVNAGKNFANLRQIFNSIILSSWYKKNLKQALLNQVYADKSKVKGINLNDPAVKEQIYAQYLKAYKKGVFNYIKEDVNASGQAMPRKYFSGGMSIVGTPAADPEVTTDPAMLKGLQGEELVDFTTLASTDAAMAAMKKVGFKKIEGTARVQMDEAFARAKINFPYAAGGKDKGEVRIERGGPGKYFIQPGDELSSLVRIRNDNKKYDFTFGYSLDQFNLVVDYKGDSRPVEYEIAGRTYRAAAGEHIKLKVENGNSVKINFAGRSIVLIRRDQGLFLEGPYELDPKDVVTYKYKDGRYIFNVSGRDSDAVGITEMSNGKGGQIEIFFEPIDLDPSYKAFYANSLAKSRVFAGGGKLLEEKDFLEMAEAMENSGVIYSGDYGPRTGADADIDKFAKSVKSHVRVFLREEDVAGQRGIRIFRTAEGGQKRYYLFPQRYFLEFFVYLLGMKKPDAKNIFLHYYHQVSPPDTVKAAEKSFQRLATFTAVSIASLAVYALHNTSYSHSLRNWTLVSIGASVIGLAGIIMNYYKVMGENKIVEATLVYRNAAARFISDQHSLEAKTNVLFSLKRLADVLKNRYFDVNGATSFINGQLEEEAGQHGLTPENKRRVEELLKVQLQMVVLNVYPRNPKAKQAPDAAMATAGRMYDDNILNITVEKEFRFGKQELTPAKVTFSAGERFRPALQKVLLRPLNETAEMTISVITERLRKARLNLVAHPSQYHALLMAVDSLSVREPEADRAALAQPPGGIDLNTSNGMQWKVSKDGMGVEMNIDPAMIERVRREGINSLSPVVLAITPVTDIGRY